MSLDYLETHFHSAKALYRQRMGWLQAERIDMQSMLDLEYRIRIHLHVLAGAIDEQALEPIQCPDTFVYLASRFTSSDQKHQDLAAHLACEWLLDDGPRGHGARDALLLFPSPHTYAVMQEAYVKTPALRPILIYILTQHGARLPKGLTNQAELQSQDPYLQAQVLYYAANDQNNSVEIFQSYYQSLIEHRDELEIDHGSLVAALWGGLLRQDTQACTALQRAIERERDDFQRLDFLRLAALSGELQYTPILMQVIEHAPEVGYHFLALHGQPASLELILDGLVHPRTSAYAETAWWWVSGQTLPKKPRLSVVGESSEEGQVEEEVGFVPDAQVAQHWWRKQVGEPAQRWFQGKPISLQAVQKVAKHYTGLISNDLFDVLAIMAKHPIKLGNHTWHDVRLRRLEKVTPVMVAPQNETQLRQEQRRA